MSEPELSTEARILQAVRMTLASVIRDTATAPGMRHPLSDATIEDLRQCMALISARQRELAQAACRVDEARPHYADEPRATSVVRLTPRKPSGEGE